MAYMRWRRFVEMTAIDRPWVGELFMRKRWEKPQAPDAAHWDEEYDSGALDRLSRRDQRHHLRLLAALVAETAPAPRILELGAGDGAFYEVAKSHAPARYVGVDLSPVAIERAKTRYGESEKVAFVVGDGRRFETDETFDAVVFPECIEYLGDPIKLFDHYRKNLAPGGLIGVTQWLGVKPLRLWRQVESATEVVDQAVVSTRWGGAWMVWTCRLK